MGCGASSKSKYYGVCDKNLGVCDNGEHAPDKRPGAVTATPSQSAAAKIHAKKGLMEGVPPPNDMIGKPAQVTTREQQQGDSSCQPESPTRGYLRALTFLSEVPVLQSLDKADLPLIAQSMTTTTYPSGEVVIMQGTVSNRLFIILSGKAEVLVREGFAEMKLVELTDGDYFGEQELLHEEVARATVRAAGDEELVTYSIAHDKFWQLGLHEKLCIPKRRAMVDLERESLSAECKATVEPKSEADVMFLAASLRANAYLPSFCELTDGLVSELAAAARLRAADIGEVLMRQGDFHGVSLYIVQHGSFDIQGSGYRGSLTELAGSFEALVKAGDSFGELELLYSVPCAATVTAVEKSTVWEISRSDFTVALDHVLQTRHDEYTEVLRGVKFFTGLYREELRALATTLTEVTYKMGEDIITQGEDGDICFVLVEGEVVILQDSAEVARRVAVRAKNEAELFGEEELLRPSPRIATVRVVSESVCVLALDKVSFELVLEPLNDILNAVKERGKSRKTAIKSSGEQLQKCVRKGMRMSRCEGFDRVINRSDLQLLGNLGSGLFGSVELAEDRRTGQRFALKRIRRWKLTQPWHRRQILAEKVILSMTQSPFLVRLYATFRDARALAFLLELVPGGDLRRALSLYDLYGKVTCAQFYTAGVVLALEHLHERRIVHRDIKPENVLLDGEGWPKVADFGLAKFCVGKTYTRCGTALYMAPEILSEAGHGIAVDWWCLGVLIYEIIDSRTPFESVDGDFLKTGQAIMQGIPSPERWSWPRGFGSSLPSLISSLLQPNPFRRLPMHSGGIATFKAHSWFDGFNWAEFEAKKLQPPATPAGLVVEDLIPSKHEKDWGNAQLATTEWDADF